MGRKNRTTKLYGWSLIEEALDWQELVLLRSTGAGTCVGNLDRSIYCMMDRLMGEMEYGLPAGFGCLDAGCRLQVAGRLQTKSKKALPIFACVVSIVMVRRCES